jgi:hypothetical protein
VIKLPIFLAAMIFFYLVLPIVFLWSVSGILSFIVSFLLMQLTPISESGSSDPGSDQGELRNEHPGEGPREER